MPQYRFVFLVASLFAWLASGPALAEESGDEPKPIRGIFLGDRGHHRPADRFPQLAPVLEARGIALEYTEDLDVLSHESLAGHDVLVIYANHTRISPEQEEALIAWVEGGGGLVPVHCASYCFLNSDAYVELVGAQFESHETGVFRTEVVRPEHSVVQGFDGFECWDETYVHHRHNEEGRTVLSIREEDGQREPWTWVRTQGEGRVFYTAWGHDERTWSHPGFQNLIERGIRWAAGRDPSEVAPWEDRPEMTEPRTDVEPFRYTEAEVPFYPPGERWGTTGEPIRQMQLPLSPEESLKHVVRPQGFEVRLFASEPDIRKPICMAWDERGRLWIAETIDYPNEKQPEGEGSDRIRILEDTDHDGRADEFTVFADGLSIPTSIAFARGGAIVHQPPHTLFLRDTDGDDRADERRVLFTGWSTDDTHAGPSNLHYGLDNWLRGICGYAGFRGEVGGRRHSFRTGLYRFRPDGSRMEFLRNTSNNSWGVGLSEEGTLFGSTANGNPSVHLAIPNRYYEAVRGWSSSVLGTIAMDSRFHPITDKVRQVDFHGRFTAAAGHALYTARTWPERYWNRAAFVCGPTGHLVATFLLQRTGSAFHSRYAWNLLASDDEWTAPIAAEVGPDGHVWVIDWYNYIVQHNPTPQGYETGRGNAYESDLRDKTHGRIWRVVWTGAEHSEPFSLADAGPEKLVRTLRHPNLLWRRHAQRLLVERGERDVAPDLAGLVRDRGTDELGLNAGAIHALWTLEGIGALDGEPAEARAAAVAALGHPSAGVRMNAARALPPSAGTTASILESGILQDDDARVRLSAALALADAPEDPAAGRAVAAAFQRPENLRDRWIPDALTSAAARHAPAFLAAGVRGDDPPRRLREALRVVSEHWARGAPVDSVGTVLAGLVEVPSLGAAEAVLRGTADGWPDDRRARLTAGEEEKLLELVGRLPAGSRGRLVRLAVSWGGEKFQEHAGEIAQELLTTAADGDADDDRRIAAIRSLVDFRPRSVETVEELLELVKPNAPPAVSRGVLEALRESEAEGTGQRIIDRWGRLPPSLREAAEDTLLSRPAWTRAFLAAAEENAVRLGDLSLDRQQALASHPNRSIRERARALLERGGSLPSPDRQEVIETLLPLTERTGDPARGREIFERLCSQCHLHGELGTTVGPDLTGMAVHPKEELLVQILDPNRSVEGNYRAYTVVTRDGRVLSGLLVSETRTSVELVDSSGEEQVVLREDILRLEGSEQSFMPEGFESEMEEQEFVDLLEFLTDRGDWLPLPLQKVATVCSARGMFHDESSRAERLVFRNWGPKTFRDVPFHVVDPGPTRRPNVVLLRGPRGRIPPRMPREVTLPCGAPAEAVHLLSGVSGWGHPLGEEGSVTMIVRLHYADGSQEDHELLNGVHFADYIRRVDVPGSEHAFDLRGRQVRYLAVRPKHTDRTIETIELVKGEDQSAPLVMAVTVELP